MGSAKEVAQERDWQVLHDAITGTLDRYGKKNAFREGDYWLLDDNWSWYVHQVEFFSLRLLQPHIIQSLRSLLADFPYWHITVRIDVPGKEDSWPGMGLIIYPDEVVDELRRDFLPEEFRNVIFGTISTETIEMLDERISKLMKR